MPWLVPMLVGAGVGAAKHYAIDVPAEGRQRRLAAETDRFSPWTGQHGQAVQEKNLIGDMAGYGAQGAAFGQSIHNSEQQDLLDKAALEHAADVHRNPWAYGDNKVISAGGPFWGGMKYNAATGAPSWGGYDPNKDPLNPNPTSGGTRSPYGGY